MKRSQLICLILTYLTIATTAFPQAQLRDLRTKYNRFNRFHKRLERLETKKNEENLKETIAIPTYVPRGGTLGQFRELYKLMHPQEIVTFPENKKAKSYFTDGYGRYYVNYGRPVLDGTMEVIAWHPYWNNLNLPSYQLDMVSIISYYSYDVEENTGDPRDWTFFDDSVAVKDFFAAVRSDSLVLKPRVLLTIASKDADRTEQILSRPVVQQRVFDVLKEFNRKFPLDGVDVQFDGINGSNLGRFQVFIQELHKAVDDFDREKSPFLTVSIPPARVNRTPLDFEAFHPYVDYFVLGGRELIGRHISRQTAPAPLYAYDGQASIDDSFWRYTENSIDWRKLIVSFPLLGTKWRYAGGRYSFTDFVFPDAIYNLASQVRASGDVGRIIYDPLSTSCKFSENRQTTYWFENEMSLDAKFRWAKSNQAAGVGVWSLGFASSFGEVWNALETNLSDSLVAIDQAQVEVDRGQLYGFVKKVDDARYQVGAGLIILIVFMIAGLFLSLFDFRVRRSLFENQYFRAVFLVVGLIVSQVVILIFIKQFEIPVNWMLWAIVSLAGGYLAYWILKSFVVYRRELP